MPYLTNQSFGNPSSSHRFGRAARAGIEQARRQIAESLGAEPGQVIFTSGGTEADNLSIVGAALAARDRGAPMCAAVSAVEHKAVLAAAHAVCHLGGREVLLPVDSAGMLELEALDRALAETPSVVSVMWVNNEVGVVQPVADIAERCRDAGVIFHTDAVQAVGKVPISLQNLCCTLLTISGHKIGAPKGIGALIVRDRKAVEAIHPRRGPAVRDPSGHRECGRRRGPGARGAAGHRGAREPSSASDEASRRAGPPAPGNGARPDGERRGKRARTPSSEHRGRRRGQRGVADAPRSRRHRGLQRIGLFDWCGGTIARTGRHGGSPGAGAGHHPFQLWPGEQHGGRGAGRGGGAGSGDKGAEARGGTRAGGRAGGRTERRNDGRTDGIDHPTGRPTDAR